MNNDRPYFFNNRQFIVTIPIHPSTTSVSVHNPQGLYIPVGFTHIVGTLVGRSGLGDVEIVHITNITNNVFTIERAQENTSAQSFLAGAVLELRLTAGVLNDFQKQSPGIRNVYNYGAIGDGGIHPLSERFETLEAAQMEYPNIVVESLDRYIDGVAWESFLHDLTMFGGIGVVGKGQFVVDKKYVIDAPQSGFSLYGDGRTSSILQYRGASTNNSALFDFRNGTGIHVYSIGVDSGYSQTGAGGHGIALRNMYDSTIQDCLSHNYNAAGIYLTNLDNSIIHNDCNIVGNIVDGEGVGNNGILFVDQRRSNMHFNKVLNLSDGATPGYAQQFKGACRDCMSIGGIVDNALGGFVFADEGGAAGTGPINCHFMDGYLKNCLLGVLSGKATNCSFNGIDIDHNGRDTGAAVSISGNNIDLLIRVGHVYNLGASASVVESRSSDITYEIGRWDGSGQWLFTTSSGQRNRLFLLDARAAAGLGGIRSKINVTGSASVPDIFSEQITQVRNQETAATLFMGDALSGARMVHLKSLDEFVFRGDASNQTYMTLGKNDSSPGVTNTSSSGRANRLWTQVYAATSAINTSDARLKTTVRPLTPNELGAATALAGEIGIYKWLHSVEEKGEAARLHVGLTVQRAISIMEEFLLDPMEYGFICHDVWDDVYETVPAVYEDVLDSEGNFILDKDGVPVVRLVAEEHQVLVQAAGDVLSFRGEMLDRFILRGVVESLNSQDNRIAALEGALNKGVS